MLTAQDVRRSVTQGCPGSALARSGRLREERGRDFDEWLARVVLEAEKRGAARGR